MSTSNQSLADRLQTAGVYDEFCALMFGQRMRYEDLLEQLEKWNISSSMGALSRFGDSQRSAWTLARAKRETQELLADESIDLDAAQRKVVAERLFNLAAAPDICDKTLLKLRDQEIKMMQLQHDKQRLEQAEVKLQQAERKLEQAERKIAALEAQAEAAEKAAERAKEVLKGGGMDDATREALLAEVDAIMLGRARPQAKVQA